MDSGTCSVVHPRELKWDFLSRLSVIIIIIFFFWAGGRRVLVLPGPG